MTDQKFEEARELLLDAKIVCILGFGSLKENEKRLGLNNIEATAKSKKHFYGTAYGLTESEKLKAAGMISGTTNTSLGRHNEGCLRYLREIGILI